MGVRAPVASLPPEPGAFGSVTAQSQSGTYKVPKTPWGEPDLQGIYNGNDLQGIPMQRAESVGTRTVLNDDEWKQRLSPEQYQVLRQAGTERAFTGAYTDVEEPGLYRCMACGNPLYTSDTKFHSGSGWPSFTEAVSPDAVELVEDHSHGMTAPRSAAPVATATSATSSPTARETEAASASA